MSKPFTFGIFNGWSHQRQPWEGGRWEATERAAHLAAVERGIASTAPSASRRSDLPSPAVGRSAQAGLHVDRTTFREGVRRGAVASAQTQALRPMCEDGSAAVMFAQAIADAAANLNQTRRL